VNSHDLLLALLLPVPPWFGFLIYRFRGRVGMSYGYFLGGILAVLALPWPQMGKDLPSPHLGGALLGFTLFIAAQRDGGKGLRRLAYGVGGATFFVWLLGHQLGLDPRSVVAFWVMALLEAGLWLLLSDLGYRITQGRWLGIRLPVTSGVAFLVATAIFRNLPLDAAPLSWLASLLAGVVLGLVALQQMLWLRRQGIWVEGRGNGFRVALSALEGSKPPEGPTLTYAIEARQPMFLVNEKGMLLEANTAFSRLVGLPRSQIRGYQLQDLFQGREAPAWEDLQEKLRRDFRGSVQTTLVRKDSSFQSARLEAVAFDRNLALVWIADPRPGTLALRGEPGAPTAALWSAVPGSQGAEHLAEHALDTILPAVTQILEQSGDARSRAAAERILAAARRMLPTGAPETQPRLQARSAMEALRPRLRRLLPPGCQFEHQTPDLTLFLEPEALRRITTQMLLHGRQGLAHGTLTLVMTPVLLGEGSWARLTLARSGSPAAWDGDFLGLTWLRDTVRQAQGLLELAHDGQAFLWPRVFLPCQDLRPERGSRLLHGRRVWIVEQDPGVREALCGLVQDAGGTARPLAGLRPFLACARREPAPDLLVLERSARLDRFQPRLARLGAPGGPGGGHPPRAILLLGDGQPWPQAPGSRLVLLSRPFPGPTFIQCLLALLQEDPSPAGPSPLSQEGPPIPASPSPLSQESPCPPSP